MNKASILSSWLWCLFCLCSWKGFHYLSRWDFSLVFQYSLTFGSGQAASESDEKSVVHVHTPRADLVHPPGEAVPLLVSMARIGPRDHPVQQLGFQMGRLRLREGKWPTSATAGFSRSWWTLELQTQRWVLKMRIGVIGSSGSCTSYKHICLFLLCYYCILCHFSEQWATSLASGTGRKGQGTDYLVCWRKPFGLLIKWGTICSGDSF